MSDRNGDGISPSPIAITHHCMRCGHTWTPRNPNAKRPECSKCRSREIEVLDAATGPERGFSEEAEVETVVNSPTKASTPPSSDYDLMAVLERMDYNHKMLLLDLNARGAITSDMMLRYTSHCDWCNAGYPHGMYLRVYTRKDGTEFTIWKCQNCGKEV